MNSINEINAPFGEEQAAKLVGHLKSEDLFPRRKVSYSNNRHYLVPKMEMFKEL